jgi:Na+/proline symporter
LRAAPSAEGPEGTTVLPVGAGYGIVLGFGVFFSLFTSLLVYLDTKYAGTQMTSEQFNTAGRSVKIGLTASVIVSQWTWAATLLQSSNVAWAYGLSGPFWYAAGASIQVLLFGILAIEIKVKAPTAHTFLELVYARWGKTAHIVFMVYGTHRAASARAARAEGMGRCPARPPSRAHAPITAPFAARPRALSVRALIHPPSLLLPALPALRPPSTPSALPACPAPSVSAFLTNMIVSAMLLLGGSAVVNALTGMDISLASFLIPWGVVLYTFAGGLKATFLASYMNTAIIFIILCYFTYTVYASSPLLGDAGVVYDKLQRIVSFPSPTEAEAAAGFHCGPVSGNRGGSYLTMLSSDGLMFGVIK